MHFIGIYGGNNYNCVKVQICDACSLFENLRQVPNPEIQSSNFKSGKILSQILDILNNFITNVKD